MKYLKRAVLALSNTWPYVIFAFLRVLVDQRPVAVSLVVALIIGTIIMLAVPLVIIRSHPTDELNKASQVKLVNNKLGLTYLSCLILVLLVKSYPVAIVLYVFVFMYAFNNTDEYFNLIFVLLGYHYYRMVSDTGVARLVILKQTGINRRPTSINQLKIYQITDSTYFGKVQA